MDDELGSLLAHGAGERGGVEDVGLDEAEPRAAHFGQPVRSGAMASEEVVDHRHGVALVEQAQCRVGADEAATAGDEDLHGALSGASRCKPRENRGDCVRNPILRGIAGTAAGLLPAASDRSDDQGSVWAFGGAQCACGRVKVRPSDGLS